MAKVDFKARWLVILVTLTAIVLVVLVFKVNILEYTCDHEENSASCYLLAEHYEENGELELAEKYHNRACNFQYEKSCSKIRPSNDQTKQ